MKANMNWQHVIESFDHGTKTGIVIWSYFDMCICLLILEQCLVFY